MMMSENIHYQGFVKKKIKKKIKLQKFLSLKTLLKNYPLLNTLTNNYMYNYDKKILNNLKKFNDYNLIGIGGSALGTKAIYDFLNYKIKKKFYFYDNLQNSEILKSNTNRLNIIVSKSGNTLETISNLNLISLRQKKNKNLIITENKKNILNKLAKKLKSEVIEHKDYIGGRYSALSEVGMLPAELMGLDVKKFKVLNSLIRKKTFVNFLISNVQSVYDNILKGKKNCVILNYDEKSNNLFKWYQQLLAESLGKNGKGVFPIVSTMPKDNHSLLQLYLDGPKNNYFTFFSVKENKSNKYNKLLLTNEIEYLKNSNVSDVLSAQRIATQKVFRKNKIPFRSFEIIKRNERAIGEIFCFFILETLLLAELLKVNPLNQPSVELIKTETKNILS
tara:strand:- start:2831 stop:4003 length:1173 start_codon:yes stop_codon:yes gene_type:complete